jgi:hypothetical protein
LLDVQAALAALLFLPRRPKWPKGLLGEMLTIGSGRTCIVADFGVALTDVVRSKRALYRRRNHDRERCPATAAISLRIVGAAGAPPLSRTPALVTHSMVALLAL